MRVENGVLIKVTDEDINPDGSFTFPSGITIIDNMAFRGCENLKRIELPDGITTIGYGAFANCENLEQIEIPESVISIGDEAIMYCRNLKEIELPDGITSIGKGAFANCENLEQIEIPENVISIGDRTFAYCRNLKAIELPDGITTIGYGAFDNCENLEQIEIPESVISIGDEAFVYCRNLKAIELPDKVTSVGDYVFCGCESLEQIRISDVVTSIGRYAFDGCKSLKEIRIPDAVTSIGVDAFKGCISLASIKIPDNGCCTGDGFTYVTKMSDGHFFFSKERLDEHSIVLSLDGAAAFYYFYHGDSMNANYNYDDMRYQYEDEYGYIGYDGYYDDYGNICFGMAPEWPKYGYMPSQYIGLKYSQSEITRELVNDFIKGTLSIRNSGITYSRNYNSSNMDMFLYRMMRLIGAEEIEKMLKVNEISEEDLRTYFDSQSQIYEKYTQKKFGVGGIDGLTIGIVKGLDKRLGTLKEKEKFEIYKRINGYLAQEDYTEFNKMLEEIYGKEKLSELQENVRNRVIENIADKLKVKNERLSQELRIPEAQLNVAKRIMKRYIKENGSVNIENIEKWFKENTGHGTDFAANWIQTKKETIVKLINESIAENKDILSNEKMIFDILKQGKEHFQRPWIRNIIGTENQVEFTREELQRLFRESYISAHENEYKSKLILKPGVSQEEFYKEIERKKYKRCHCL